jgi:hypothetical protein
MGRRGAARRLALTALAGWPLLLARRAGANEALAAPAGPVVLDLVGRIARRNSAVGASFDMPMLAALPQASFVTRTPWYAQARSFTGPLLRDVLALAGAEGRTLRLIALNDYQVEMPVDDAQRHDVLIARLVDDRPMAVRDKGPLFIIYPFDAQPALRSATYYSRSAWQLRTIEVL